MQGDFSEMGAFDFQAFHQFFGEMEPGGGGGHGADFFGQNGLISFFIQAFRRPFDVFGQGGMPQDFQLGLEVVVASIMEKPDGPSTAGGIVHHFSHQDFVSLFVVEVEFVPHADLTGRVDQNVPKPGFLIQFPQQEDFDLGAGFFFLALHSGREDLGIVENEGIPVFKDVEDIFKILVFDFTGIPVYDH